MQGPVRRLLSHLGKSIANSFNWLDCLWCFYYDS
jgi:hypothetical protein